MQETILTQKHELLNRVQDLNQVGKTLIAVQPTSAFSSAVQT